MDYDEIYNLEEKIALIEEALDDYNEDEEPETSIEHLI